MGEDSIPFSQGPFLECTTLVEFPLKQKTRILRDHWIAAEDQVERSQDSLLLEEKVDSHTCLSQIFWNEHFLLLFSPKKCQIHSHFFHFLLFLSLVGRPPNSLKARSDFASSFSEEIGTGLAMGVLRPPPPPPPPPPRSAAGIHSSSNLEIQSTHFYFHGTTLISTAKKFNCEIFIWEIRARLGSNKLAVGGFVDRKRRVRCPRRLKPGRATFIVVVPRPFFHVPPSFNAPIRLGGFVGRKLYVDREGWENVKNPLQ